MKTIITKSISLFLIIILFTSCNHNDTTETINDAVIENSDPLPSWKDGATKSAIIDYVNDVTKSESPNFIEIKDRIATFDNDGNLWSEQPAYFQLFFVIDRIKAMAVDHPEWKTQQPFKAVLENDMEEVKKQGEHGLVELVLATHTGKTIEEFDADVKNWISTAKHSTKNVTYDKLVYQPMLELLQYLQENNFKPYVVSGGGIDFMRAFVSPIYNIPSEQIIGSRIKTKFEYNNGDVKIAHLPEFEFNNDKDGKALNIQKIIGKKPVFSSGNSDGDLQMMQYTASNKLKSFMLYVHHTDSVREWAYDRKSSIGRLDKGLDEANEKGWTVIDMEKDWELIYPFELAE